MATKTFSSRADETSLAYADAMVRERFGMSFGQYCGSVLIDAIRQGAELPEPPRENAAERKAAALSKLKALASLPNDASVGHMTDDQIDDLIASRYA
ncbi:MAG: hypothetical protein IJ087_10640 [Eggerthellaceae bacterium]|nr:hypothetical protein [Eggerthellaceae bacterium]